MKKAAIISELLSGIVLIVSNIIFVILQLISKEHFELGEVIGFLLLFLLITVFLLIMIKVLPILAIILLIVESAYLGLLVLGSLFALSWSDIGPPPPPSASEITLVAGFLISAFLSFISALVCLFYIVLKDTAN